MTDYAAYRDKFAAVTDARYYPIEWLDQRIAEGRATFMATGLAAIVVELRQFPGGAVDVHGLVAAGDRDDIVNILIPRAEAFGRDNGCVAGVVESRPGWAKALKSSGYQVSQVTVRKEL